MIYHCVQTHSTLFCIHVFFRGWKCARCDLKENLWLNLTDGTILCGRRYFDGWYLHENTFSLKVDSKLCEKNCKYNDCQLFPAYWGRNKTIFIYYWQSTCLEQPSRLILSQIFCHLSDTPIVRTDSCFYRVIDTFSVLTAQFYSSNSLHYHLFRIWR